MVFDTKDRLAKYWLSSTASRTAMWKRESPRVSKVHSVVVSICPLAQQFTFHLHCHKKSWEMGLARFSLLVTLWIALVVSQRTLTIFTVPQTKTPDPGLLYTGMPSNSTSATCCLDQLVNVAPNPTSASIGRGWQGETRPWYRASSHFDDQPSCISYWSRWGFLSQQFTLKIWNLEKPWRRCQEESLTAAWLCICLHTLLYPKDGLTD